MRFLVSGPLNFPRYAWIYSETFLSLGDIDVVGVKSLVNVSLIVDCFLLNFIQTKLILKRSRI